MTKIEYNGSVVATVEGGNTATLPIKDKKMKSDIVITVPKAETVEEYDGAIVIEEGESLISFTVNGTSCQAEDGMIWMDWINTDYNTVGAFRGTISENTTISLTVNGASQILQLNGTDVIGKNAIVSGASYTSRATTGAD